MLCSAVRQDTWNAIPGKAAYLALLWSLLPTFWGGSGDRLRRHFFIGAATENSEGYPVPAKNRAPACPPPMVGPGALPGGPEEFTAEGAEAVEHGGAATTGVLVSGGNIRSCFLTFNFLR